MILTSGAQEGFPLLPGTRDFDYDDGTLFSILGFSTSPALTVTGAKWPLDSVEVPFGSSLTISNEVRGDLRISLGSRPRAAARPSLSRARTSRLHMAPPLLKLDGIVLTFGGTPLLDGAELVGSAGDRIALVGRNGSGKSTLLKIAAGLIEPQDGEVFRHPSATVRYLPQMPDMDGFATVRAYVEAGLGPADDPHRATYLLEHLGLTGEEKPGRTFRRRGAPRSACPRHGAASPTSCCSTSRPTISTCQSIEWLEEELARSSSALVVISHDRRFLERVSRATVWLDRGQTRRLDKGFAHFEEWRDTILEEEEREQHKLGRQIVREEHWLRYGVTARRKRNMRRLGELQTMRSRFRGHRGAEGAGDDGGQRRRRIRQAGDRGQEHLQELWRPDRGEGTSRPASSAATASAWSARTAPARRRC